MKRFVVLILVIYGFCFVSGNLFADPAVGYWISVDDRTGQPTAGWRIYQQGDRLLGMIISFVGIGLPEDIRPEDVIAIGNRESYPGFPIPGKTNEMPVIGTPWIFGLSQVREGEWNGGNIIDPESGRMYRCRIIFHPAGSRIRRNTVTVDTLEMRGEIGLGIGRSQFWQRSDMATASSLR